MRLFAPAEWSATLGWVAWRFWLLIYTFSFVLALLIGVAPLPGAAIAAVILWTCGALIVAAGAAYCLCRFRRQAASLLLPRREMVFWRSATWLSLLVVVLPDVSFWMLVPGSRHWEPLITFAPITAALAVPLCLQFVPASQDRRNSRAARYARRTTGSVIRMFIGSPFTKGSTDLRTRVAAVLCVLVWATPPVLCLMLPARARKPLTIAYLAVTFIVLWSWLMSALARFRSQRTGSFAELALLPGLGDASSRRHALYRAVLTRPLLLAFGGYSGLLLYACWQRHSLARIGSAITCEFVLLLFCSAAPFQLLMGKDQSATPFRAFNAINATLVPLVVSQAVITTFSGQAWSWLSRPGVQPFFLLLAALLAAVPLLTIWLYTSGLARQAHPFLAPSD